jgi:Zn-dependent metalloprotease
MNRASSHHHMLHCILPPHMLRAIAARGSATQRSDAQRSLAVDSTMRLHRTTVLPTLMRGARATMVTAPVAKQRTIYTAGNKEVLPGTTVRSEGQGAVNDIAVNEAYDGLGATFDFYLGAYQRNSIDDAGLGLDATVHYGNQYNNAFWNGTQMVFGDGDGELFNRFTISLDVIGHELTHGVTGFTAQLVYLNEPGALNESVSDVFGSLVKQYGKQQQGSAADWLIGTGLFTSAVQGTALRSMKAPGTAYNDPVLGQDPQPAHMDNYVQTAEDNGGVHINSGIPNHAFYLLAIALGGFAWEKAGRIWYETLRDPGLSATASFLAFAQRTALQAGHLYGSSSRERLAVVDAWKQVGIPIP